MKYNGNAKTTKIMKYNGNAKTTKIDTDKDGNVTSQQENVDVDWVEQDAKNFSVNEENLDN